MFYCMFILLVIAPPRDADTVSRKTCQFYFMNPETTKESLKATNVVLVLGIVVIRYSVP